jgi:TRAP-type C4-dicarboxylate transport system permease large subunit
MFRVVALSRLMTLTLVGMVLGIVLAASIDARPLLAGLTPVAFPAATAFAYDAVGR